MREALARDVAPAPGLGTLAKVLVAVAIVALLLLLVARCSRDDCDELKATFGEASNEYLQCRRASHGSGGFWRTVGGSQGGYSTGGSHK